MDIFPGMANAIIISETFQIKAVVDWQIAVPFTFQLLTRSGRIFYNHTVHFRHFIRRYVLPQDNDIADVVSTLSSDGVLTITAPKKSIKDKNAERVVPITQTGPAKQTVQPVIEEK